MALNGAALGAAIATKVKELGYVVDDSTVDDIWGKVGEAVVDYIVANAVVTTTVGAPDSEHTGNIT